MHIILLILFIIFFISIYSFFSLAPWVPTLKKDLEKINKILLLKDNEKFLEMWCWTLRVSLYVAKNNPESFITGIEFSPFFYLISKIKVFFSWLKNIEVKFWNALNLDLEKFDAIYVFWLPETITNKIFPKLSKTKNKNFRFVSYCFQMQNDYFKENKYKEKNRYAIYQYKL